MTLIPIFIIILSLLWGGRAPMMGATAPTFSITVARNGDHITLRYPADVGEWREVCVTTITQTDEWEMNCWAPYIAVEDHKIRPNAVSVKGQLLTTKDGVRTEWSTPWVNVRPIQGEGNED